MANAGRGGCLRPSDAHLEMWGRVSGSPHRTLPAAALRGPPGSHGGVQRLQPEGVAIPRACTQRRGQLPGPGPQRGRQPREQRSPAARLTRGSLAPAKGGARGGGSRHSLRQQPPPDNPRVYASSRPLRNPHFSIGGKAWRKRLS